MSSPNRPSQESFSSSTNGQGTEQASLLSSTDLVVSPEELAPPTLSLPSNSSDDDGRNVLVMRRYFCPTCNCAIILDLFVAWTVSCPICHELFQPEQEGPAASASSSLGFPSQSRASRSAGFEDWNLDESFFYIEWDCNFFFRPISSTSSEVVSALIPSAGMVISKPFLQSFLEECFKSGASITMRDDKEITTSSLLSELEAILANLELRDSIRYSCEMACCICLDSLANGKKVRAMPCNHSFHENCLLPWMFRDKTCPLCRFKLIIKTDTGLYTNTVEDPRPLRKFMIQLQWQHGGRSSQAEASSSGGGHDASHTG